MKASAPVLVLLLTMATASAQIYTPPAPRTMWDTWVYSEAGEYQLFFLQSDPGQVWNTVGRADSRDLLHWRTLPAIETKGAPGAWDHEPTLTGITVKHAGRYYMFYAATVNKGQEIGVMFSDDLKNWTRYERNPFLRARGPEYGGADWRDLYAWHDPHSGLWNAATCARTSDGRSAISHLVSKDLLEWEYLAPLYVDASFSDMEVPEYFELGGKHYLLFSNIRSRRDIGGRRNAAGTYYVMSENRDGPYRLMPGSLLLGSGQGRFDVYVGRTLLHGGHRLLYSQTVGGTVSWSTPKLIRQDPDGELWLEWWPELAKLETSTVLQKTTVTAGVQAAKVEDAQMTVEVEIHKGGRAALKWRAGTVVTLDAAAGKVSVAQEGATADEIEVAGLDAKPRQLRLFCRAQRSEVYLDGRWLFNYRLKGQPAAVPVELTGAATFRHLRIAALEPMSNLPVSAR